MMTIWRFDDPGVWGEKQCCHRRTEGLPVNESPFLDSYSMPSEGKSDQYASLLRALPPGLTEWAVHPGLGNGEARAMEPTGWPVRRADYEFVTSPEAKSVIEEEGIVLLSYRELQQCWVAVLSQ
jgi:chitin disaccharide deacetylase